MQKRSRNLADGVQEQAAAGRGQGDRTAKISDPMMNFAVKGSSGTPPPPVFQIRQLHVAFVVYNYRPREPCTVAAARGIADTFKHAHRPRILSRRSIESLIGKKIE